jgi:hypothetical protein
MPPVDGDDPGRTVRCRAAIASILVAALELAWDGTQTLAQDAARARVRVRNAAGAEVEA